MDTLPPTDRTADDNESDLNLHQALLKIMEECRAEYVRQALAYRGDASPGMRRRLDQAMERRFGAKWSPKRAPTEQQIAQVCAKLDESAPLLRTLLLLWMESRPQLVLACKRQLDKQDIPQIDLARYDLSAGEVWNDALFEPLMTGIALEHRALAGEPPDVRDTLLMLSCLTGWSSSEAKPEPAPRGAPAAQEAPAPQEQPQQPDLWAAWLEHLRALPAHAPEWDGAAAEDFLAAVRDTAAGKRAERERGRELLRAALASLLAETGDELSYFGYDQVAGWSADGVDSLRAAELAADVEQLQAELARHRELSAQPRPARVELARQQRAALDVLEASIAARVGELDTLLAPPPPSDPTPEDDGGSRAPEADAEAPGAPETPPEPARESLPAAEGPPETPAEPIELHSSPDEQPDSHAPPAAPGMAAHMPDEADAGESAAQPHREDQPPADQVGSAPQPVQAAETFTAADQATSEGADAPTARAAVAGRCSAREHAQHIIDAGGAGIGALQWTLIAEDDLPGAYWLARSLAASASAAPVPSWLIVAVQGARWLTGNLEAYIDDLRQIALHEQPAADEASRLMALAAALRPTLLTPAAGLVSWLSGPAGPPQLRELVEAVERFASTGIALRPEDLHGVAGADQREAALLDVAASARQWIFEAPQRRTIYAGADRIWREIVGPRGGLRTMLLPIADDNRSAVEPVRRQLAEWERRDYILGQVQTIREHIASRKTPIDGRARDQIILNINEACAIARRWCELIERGQDIERRGSWIFAQVAHLRETVRLALPAALAALLPLAESGDLPRVAAARCLARACLQLGADLNLPAGPDAAGDAGRFGRMADGRSVSASLNRYLLWMPEIPLQDNGEPSPATLAELATTLCRAYAEDRDLVAAFDTRLRQQDYRFAHALLDIMPPAVDTGELVRRYEDALSASRSTLQANLAQTESAIVQGLLDGTVTEEEHTALRSEASAIDVTVVEAFQPRYDQLQRIRERLAASHLQRRTQLEAIWATLRQRLAGSPIDERQGQMQEFIASRLASDDTRVVEELLARISEALDNGADLDSNWLSHTPAGDPLRDFMQALPRIEESFRQAPSLQSFVAAIRDGRSRADLQFGHVPEPRRKEALDGIQAWQRLKQAQPDQRDVTLAIAQVLGYAGFSLDAAARSPIRVESRGGDWVHARAAMSASNLAKPLPQFGSQAGGQYDVVCLWERPAADTIAARLQELRLNLQSVLVLYLGRLNSRQRRAVAQMSQDRDLAIAVLDEILLVYLAQERAARLPLFLRCAAPFAALNPYTPFQAGDVPPEMFFGRMAEASELQRPKGSCLVYGGRQLGKSALLRHVQREFHHPEREQFACVIDIKRIGDPLSAAPMPEVIWSKLRDGLKAAGALSSRLTTDKPAEIERAISDMMKQRPQRRVLVLFDEADNFLEADAARSFQNVDGMRALMAATERRFKVVFAGLHNVQRFQGIPNQPLAHFGAPLQIGPLEPDAALKLVREPLEAVGYRFADDATALLILSYTNYHPGLIQIFCQELLKRLQARRGAAPPYGIERRDVEAIYRDPGVRERIRERFNWTLALDMRYQAIAWTLIDEQIQIRDSYAQEYSRREVLEMVRSAWPLGFNTVDDDQLRSLLDEMCGLGVLVRTSAGAYRLRSPNLVRLMGTDEEIRVKLIELSYKTPLAAFDADHHHAPLADGAQPGCYSPLTYAQERGLAAQKYGVGLIFASQALGLDALPQTFAHFVPRDGSEALGAVIELPGGAWPGASLRDWLERSASRHESCERLVVHHRVGALQPEQIAHLVREADAFCQRLNQRRRARWMRVLFLFDPAALLAWLALPTDVRAQLENRVDAVEAPRRWNEIGVRQRLDQGEAMDSPEVCRAILDATGGWPTLLDALFETVRPQSDPRPEAQAFAQQLRAPGSPLRAQFRMALGLEASPAVARVLTQIAADSSGAQGVPADIGIAYLADASGISQAACETAVLALQRLGCVEIRDDMLHLAPIIREVVLPQ